MINFKPNKMTNSWGKGFLTSVLGTTISIILTFGTSALLESKEKADIQRQTAMLRPRPERKAEGSQGAVLYRLFRSPNKIIP